MTRTQLQHQTWTHIISDIDPVEIQLGIVKLLKNINTKKANGPDGISCWVLKEASDEIAPFLQFIFNQSNASGQVPKEWKYANVTPVFKKGCRKEACNYRPVSLTSVPCKIMAHIVFSPHHGSPRYTPCACRLSTWISSWPLMRYTTNNSHRTTGQKSR